MIPNSGKPAAKINESLIFCVILLLLFLCPASWLILGEYGKGSNFSDQIEYHVPTIEQYVRQWPNFDLRDHGTAQTPAYHLFLAALSHYFGADFQFFQFVGAFFTIGLILTLFIALKKRTDPRTAFRLSLPMICSIYIFQAGVWIMTDNPATWGVLGMFVIALRKRVDRWTYIGGGVLSAILVSFRQIHLWTVALLWMAAWLGSGNRIREDQKRTFIKYYLQKENWRRLALAAVATIPAFAILFYFVNIWKGLAPPRFKTFTIFTPVSLPFILTLFAIYGFFFLPYIWEEILSLFKTRPRAFWLVLAGTVFLSILPHSTYNYAAHRYGGLWNYLHFFPAIKNRSFLILIMAPLGALMILAWSRAYKKNGLNRERILMGISLCAFMSAHMISFPYQRHHEPFILMFLLLSASYIHKTSADRSASQTSAAKLNRWISAGRTAGPVVLALFLAILTYLTLR